MFKNAPLKVIVCGVLIPIILPSVSVGYRAVQIDLPFAWETTTALSAR
jgi:hypothetical protein